MSEQVAEVVRLKDGHWREVRIKMYDGQVATVGPEQIKRTAGFGHVVNPHGGVYTLNGECRELHYEVTVTLDGRDWVWLHSFVVPESTALLAATAPTPDEVGLVGDGWEYTGPDPMITGGLADDVEVLVIEDDR